ncbi:hypothetical protein ACWGRF_19955 [Streptomyces zhihengii]
MPTHGSTAEYSPEPLDVPGQVRGDLGEAEEARLRSLIREWVPPVRSDTATWWQGD